MAKAVADTIGENQAGFAFDTTVVSGFSHMHDSGTGGVCSSPLPRTAHEINNTSHLLWGTSLSLLNPRVQTMISINANGSLTTEQQLGIETHLRLVQDILAYPSLTVFMLK